MVYLFFMILIYFVAIHRVFPNAETFLCSWHVSNNLKKQFLYLSRRKDNESKKLYQEIVNLPYAEKEEKYLACYNAVQNNSEVSQESKEYLKKRHETRTKWVKAYMKIFFTGGTCTNSRIEGKHSIYKKFLNSDSSLSKLYKTFKVLENVEIENYHEDIAKFTQKEDFFQNFEMMKNFEKIYTPYVINRIKGNLIEALNYDVILTSEAKK